MSAEKQESRDFHIGDILSITTGRLVSPRHVDGIYDILNYMTGDSLSTHQLPRAMEQCKPFLFEEHPQLGSVDGSNVNEHNWRKWLKEQEEQLGEKLPVKTLPLRDRVMKDPIQELREMGVAEDKIITIDPTSIEENLDISLN